MNPTVPDPEENTGPPPSGSGNEAAAADLTLVHSLRAHGPGRVVFQRFRLVRELGRGGMAVVWLAHDERLGLEVALKFLPGLVVEDADALHDLRREIMRGLQLTHRGIVRVYDLHEDRAEGLAAIAMEYVPGPTLTEEKARQPARCFEPATIREWMIQLCEILAYVHEEAKVVHRDLKPRNLMLTEAGRLKVTDFGIAATIADSHSRLTQQAGSSGTPAYMSPQQISGQRPAASDDLYAVGATIYELLTGKPPFFRGTMVAILHQVVSELPARMNDRRAELGVTGRAPIPLEWEELVAACLEKDPARRPSSAREVAERLAVGSRAPALASSDASSDSPSTALSTTARSEAAPVTSFAASVVPPTAAPSSAPAPAAAIAAEPTAKPVPKLDPTIPPGDSAEAGFPARSNGRPKPMQIVFAALLLLAIGGAIKWRSGAGKQPPPSAPRPGAVANVTNGGAAATLPISAPSPAAQAEIAAALKEAADSLRSANLAEARRLYQSALTLAPENITAQQGLAEVERHEAAEAAGAQTARESRPAEDLAANPRTASKEAPFTNSLRMEFVPVPGTNVLFCRTDTRVKEFREYAEAEHYQQTGGIYVAKVTPSTGGPGKAAVQLPFRRSGWPGAAMEGGRAYCREINSGPPTIFGRPGPGPVNTYATPAPAPSRPTTAPAAPAPAHKRNTEPDAEPTKTKSKEGGRPNQREAKHPAAPGYTLTWKLDLSASWEKPGFPQTGDHPVVGVSWEEANAFCQWLSKKEGRTYRLPTDEEWSAAAGSEKYPWSSAWPPPKGSANYGDAAPINSLPKSGLEQIAGNDGAAYTSPTASYAANRLGLYDLAGNVWQWCVDEYRTSLNEPEILKAYPPLKEDHFATGAAHVVRGGSWACRSEIFFRSSCRGLGEAGYRSTDYGFRCVLDLSGAAKGNH